MKKIIALSLLLSAATLFAQYNGGSGTSSDPYKISTLSDLAELCQTPSDWDKYFKQTADIDASQTQYWDDSDDDGDGDRYNDAHDATSDGDNQGFFPIGKDYNKYFYGVYDGDYHTISNLTIDRSAVDSNYIGLFGYVRGVSDSGRVTKLYLSSVNISGRQAVGGLCGQLGGKGSISHCWTTGSVSGYSSVGGLVGMNSGMIYHCNSSATVSGTSNNVGGLVGDNYYGHIKDSYSMGGNVSGDHSVGGFVGNSTNGSPTISHCHSSNNVSGTGTLGGFIGNTSLTKIMDCYSTGNVTGTAINVGGFIGYHNSTSQTDSCYSTGNASGPNQVGGFIGYNASPVTNSYSRGDVTRTGTGSGKALGAFIGYNTKAVEYCYSTGDVYSSAGVTWAEGGSSDKGFVGDEAGGTYKNNFWDSQVSNQSTATGATAKTTSQMTDVATFTDYTDGSDGLTTPVWDFVTNPNDDSANNDAWDMDQEGTVNDYYPILSWQTGADNLLPVELISFSASMNNNQVNLAWQTATEVNNYGFQVERKKEKVGSKWENIGFVEGAGNSNSIKEYSFTDENPPNEEIQYRLKQIDIDGQFEYSEIIEVEIGAPTKFELTQNYPNPFNPTTTISYAIPSVETRHALSVQLIVYDLLGRKVATLVNEKQSPGNYSVEFDASKLSSGIYFYRLSAGGFVSVKKMILMK